MASTSLPAPIFKEVLNKENYKEWSVGIGGYLSAQDPWDAVVEDYQGVGKTEEEEEKHQVWRRKNDEAFRAIMESFGKETADLISHLSSAKAAWDKLASEYGSPSHLSPQNPGEETYGYDPQYQPLYKAIQNGDWQKTKRFIDAHSGALTAKISYQGKTALHVAAAFIHLDIVECLVKLMSEEDLALEDGDGCTPLIHACSVEIFEMVQCLVIKNKNILTIPELIDHFLPITLAIVRGHKDMVRYLYPRTPLEVFSPQKGHYSTAFLIECPCSKEFGLALDLFGEYPNLAITADADENTFVDELAFVPCIPKWM